MSTLTVRNALNHYLSQPHAAAFKPYLLDMRNKTHWLHADETKVANIITKLNTLNHQEIPEFIFETSPLTDQVYMLSLQDAHQASQDALQHVNDIKADTYLPDVQVPLKTHPYRHQLKALAISTSLPQSAMLMDTGTGKSLVVVGTAGHLYTSGLIKRLLIICPKSVIPVWTNEFEKHADFPFWVSTFADSVNFKPISEHQLNVMVINYEYAWRREDMIFNWHPDMVVLDESQRIKSHKTKQAKFCHKLGDRVTYKMITTATMVSKNYIDIFSQYRFLHKDIFTPYVTHFKRDYCEIDNYLGYEQITGYKNLEDLKTKLNSIAFTVNIEDCTDMPEAVDKIEYCYLEKSARIYKDMDKDAMASLYEAVDACDNGIFSIAKNILNKLLLLQRITGGFLPVGDKYANTDELKVVGTEKLDLLKSLIEDMPDTKKVVIFARFRAEINAIIKMLTSMGRKCLELTGDTKDRGELVRTFQTDDTYTVIVAQIQVGGVGIELNAADTTIFYSMDFNYDSYKQCKGRIRRMNKPQICTYIHLIAKDTIDEIVLKALEKKQDLAAYVSGNNSYKGD